MSADERQADTIFVGIDFSESSQLALKLAIEICISSRSKLELIHVWTTHRDLGSEELRPDIEYWIRDNRKALRARMEEMASQAKEWGVATTCRVMEGTPSVVLSEATRSADASLIVLGRRGASNLAHVLLGSVSERVSCLAHVPVLIVPETDFELRSPRRLLVGVDFSEASRCAYDYALSLAQQMQSPNGIVLAHARPGAQELLLQDWGEEVFEGQSPYQRSDLEHWATQSSAAGIETEIEVIEGRPANSLLAAAETQNCDWIVVGAQGRTAIGALIMGGSTNRLLKITDRPIVVVPPSAIAKRG